MTTDKREIAEYAEELGERFPDLAEYEVLLSVSEFSGWELQEDMTIGRLAISAYCNGAEHALKTWGDF